MDLVNFWRVVCHFGDLDDFYLSQSSLEDHLDRSSPGSFIALQVGKFGSFTKVLVSGLVCPSICK